MSCEGSHNKYLDTLCATPAFVATFGSSAMAKEVLEEVHRLAKEQASQTRLNAKTKQYVETCVRTLFARMQEAGLKPPTHSKSGLPKRDSQIAYTSLFELIHTVEKDGSLTKLGARIFAQKQKLLDDANRPAHVQAADAAFAEAATELDSDEDQINNTAMADLFSKLATSFAGEPRHVIFGGPGSGFATDMRGSIYLDPRPLAAPATMQDNIIVIEAGAFHELGHEKYTRRDIWARVLELNKDKAYGIDEEGLNQFGRAMLPEVFNIVEDGRMERCLANEYLGIAETLALSCQLQPRWDEVVGPTVQRVRQVMGAMLYTALPYFSVREGVRVAMGDEARTLFESVEPLVQEAVHAPPEESFERVLAICKRLQHDPSLTERHDLQNTLSIPKPPEDTQPYQRQPQQDQENDQQQGQGRSSGSQQDDQQQGQGRGSDGQQDDQQSSSRASAGQQDDPQGRGRKAAQEDPQGSGQASAGQQDDQQQGQDRQAAQKDSQGSGRASTGEQDDPQSQARGSGGQQDEQQQSQGRSSGSQQDDQQQGQGRGLNSQQEDQQGQDRQAVQEDPQGQHRGSGSQQQEQGRGSGRQHDDQQEGQGRGSESQQDEQQGSGQPRPAGQDDPQGQGRGDGGEQDEQESQPSGGAGGAGGKQSDVPRFSQEQLDAARSRIIHDAAVSLQNGVRRLNSPTAIGRNLHKPLANATSVNQRFRAGGKRHSVTVLAPTVDPIADQELLDDLAQREPQIKEVAKKLGKQLKSIRGEIEQRQSHLKEGQIDRRRFVAAVKGASDVYSSTQQSSETQFASSLVIDLSGSMYREVSSGSLYDATRILGETFDDLDMRYEVRGFGSSELVFKNIGDPTFAPERAAILAKSTFGGTLMADSAGLATNALRACEEKNRFMTVLSDGDAADHELSVQRLKEARESGVLTFGIFLSADAIGFGTRERLNELYGGEGNWTHIRSVHELPNTVGKRLATLFKRMKK
jgi:hypothetical protein